MLGGRPAAAAITPGKPFAGKEIKVLAVQSTQFAAHAKKVAAFAEQTGIKVTYVYVPFVALRERLTAEMVGGSDDFDVVTAMDVWIPPLVDKYLAPIDKDIAARKIDLKRYPEPFLASAKFPDGRLRPADPLPHPAPVVPQGPVRQGRPAAAQDLGRDGRGRQEGPGAEPRHRRRHHPLRQGQDGQNLMVWYNFLWGAGGDLFDKDMKPIFNSPAGIKATQDFTDIILKHKITPAGAASFNEADSTTYFFQGKAAMVPVWWHVYNRLRLPDARRQGRPGRLRAAAVLPGQGRDHLHQQLDLRHQQARPRTGMPRWSSWTTSPRPRSRSRSSSTRTRATWSPCIGATCATRR